MKLYPYSLWVQTIAANATQDTLGNWVNQTGTFSLAGKCRDVASSAGATVTLADSTEQVYDFLISLPKSAAPIAPGTSVRVIDSDGTTVRVQGTVKRFYKGQLSCRIWV